MDNDIIALIDQALDEGEPYSPADDPYSWNDAAVWTSTGDHQDRDDDERDDEVDPLRYVDNPFAGTYYQDPSDPPWLVTPVGHQHIYDHDEPAPAVWEVSRQPPGCYSDEPQAGQTVVLSATLSDGLRTCYFTYVHGEDPQHGEWDGDADMLEAVRILGALDPPDDPLRMIAGALARVGWWGTVSDSVWQVLAGDDY
ncbi:hypothetical protein [Mycolicibacterium fallax]|uniref:Uncharacterized protein n=1 Tax=Mycolicibacterium fallax TaxID=1793 RepID=A0A1X1R7Q7_MYCFA|nr:hypothetical protein [Mycolicibacterium fallax]ORV00956.1 hypothetical protein AWC04_14885 [Mycolicibacterium fallax]BBZ00509.1 hypothetical protein MFAL_39750 [Mycolicibacterium fallax]